MMDHTRRQLWLRWVIANSLGEMIGLGATFAVAAFYFTTMQGQPGAESVVAGFLVAVASGGIEAAVVGLAQWWAMHPIFLTISLRSWCLATLVGALLAYLLGYLPSTLMSLAEETTQAQPAAEPPQVVVMLLAAGMGLVGGAVLSFAQWLVLRKPVQGSWIWIPANMGAWALGMPLIFWGIDTAQKGQPAWQAVLIIAVSLLAAGAAVGAVHGAALVRLAKQTN